MESTSPFAALERRSPGSSAATQRLLAMVDPLPTDPVVVEVGCGTGLTAGLLAAALGSPVVGVDLDLAAARASNDRPGVHGVAGSMDALPFAQGTVDLLWCEGAIYAVGFARGLGTFAHVLAPGGTAVVSDLVWNEGDRPEVASTFWGAAYPDMATLAERIDAAEALGFSVVGTDVVEPAAWWEEYYDRIETWLNDAEPTVAARWSDLRREVDVRRRAAASYDYVAMVLRAPSAQPPATAGTIDTV